MNDDEVEIELTKGQAGYRGVNSCPVCNKFIEQTEDSVRIGIDCNYGWIHLLCFIKMSKEILEKAGYFSNPSKRNAH
jgi:hypothetical protein